MGAVLKVICGALIAVILGLTIQQQRKDIALLLSTTVTCMIVMVGISYLKPVVEFVKQIHGNTETDPEFLRILLKSVGIGLIAEIAGMICSDAGNKAQGKAIQIFATTVILWLSLPLMTSLLDLVRRIMEAP